MRRLVFGVIGHVDHGKTALVRALTGTDTDRLPEEKRRGISIALGFAYLAGAAGIVDLVDMPGHERFVRTMISGATGIDAVLLVVAANEGIKPQTVEHIDIAGLLGLRRAVVVVSKTDLAAPEEAARVGEAASVLLRRAGLEPAGVVLASALHGFGIEAVSAAMFALAAVQETRAADGIVFLPVDRAFSIAGHGTVVTGTLRGGPIAAGQVLEAMPGGRAVRVRAVQVHGGRVASAAPGQRVAVNLRDVEPSDVERGTALAEPGMLAASAWFTVQLRAVDGAPPLRNGTRLRTLFGTTELEGRLRLLDRDVLYAGESGLAQLHLERPAVVPAREHVVLRLASPAGTVAGGQVLEAETRRHRRHDGATLHRLAGLATLAPDEIVGAEVERAGSAGTTLHALSRLSALGPARVVQVLQAFPVVVGRGNLVVQKAALDAVIARVHEVLAVHPLGLPRDKLLAGVPGAGGDVLDEAVARHLAAGTLRQQSGLLSVPRREADRERASTEERLAAQLAETLRHGGLTPPDAGTIACGIEGRRALARLVRDGIVVRAHDRVQKREILFHHDAIETARRQLAPLLACPPGLLVSDVGAALGISRKFSVPLLEYLDEIRFTRRAGDRRVLVNLPVCEQR